MVAEPCFAGVCFIPLDPNGTKFFGFSEFLAGLALMVLAWTIADVRYRFRIRTAPIPLRGSTFGVVATVGVLTLLTDLWRAEGWLVPRGNVLTPASWQAILAALFLVTFLSWAWFAFIRPATYGRKNATRYVQALYAHILRGNPSDLAVVADELADSARAIVRYATNVDRFKGRGESQSADESTPRPTLPKVEAYANDILLLIADKRFCRAIVESAPVTAWALFEEMSKARKYRIQISIFAKNLMSEAIANKNSFLYHEVEGYESGLLGYHKPLSQAMFSNYEMVESIETLLDPDLDRHWKWDAEHWQAYCRVVLMTVRGYVDQNFGIHSTILYRAKHFIERAGMGLHKLNGVSNSWESDEFARLRVVVDFIQDVIGILDEKGVPEYVSLRVRVEHGHPSESIYDWVASIIFEVILDAAAVTTPQWECWSVQHNAVWSELFQSAHLRNTAGAVVKFKVRRLLYDEIVEMRKFPNFKGARILCFCLNVMGLRLSDARYDRDIRALHKAMLVWTKKNYAWLHSYNPRVAEACLVEDITFDAENLRLVKTYPAKDLRREAKHIYLPLDPAPVEEIVK